MRSKATFVVLAFFLCFRSLPAACAEETSQATNANRGSSEGVTVRANTAAPAAVPTMLGREKNLPRRGGFVMRSGGFASTLRLSVHVRTTGLFTLSG